MSELNILELGEDVAIAMRAENYGLIRQRVESITKRRRWRQDWTVIYEGGIPVRMEWGWVYRR